MADYRLRKEDQERFEVVASIGMLVDPDILAATLSAWVSLSNAFIRKDTYSSEWLLCVQKSSNG